MEINPQETYRAAEQRLFGAYGVDPQEHLVDVKAPATQVRVLEVGKGEPILFLHGSPNNGASWVGLAAAMPNARCLMLDCPGAGLSSQVTKWGDHRQDTAAVVKAVLDQLGIERVALVGSSLGGLYAYNYALTHPEQVTSLTLLGCPAGPAVLPIPIFERILAAPIPVSWLLAMFKPSPKLARKMFADIGHGPAVADGRIPDAVFEWYEELLRHTETMRNTVEEVRAFETPFGRKPHGQITEEELAQLRPPVLYLWGDADPMAKPAHADALAALTPGARIEHLDGFGHLPWLDDPTAIASRLSTFLHEVGQA